jgi:hypothetical protein
VDEAVGVAVIAVVVVVIVIVIVIVIVVVVVVVEHGRLRHQQVPVAWLELVAVAPRAMTMRNNSHRSQVKQRT